MKKKLLSLLLSLTIVLALIPVMAVSVSAEPSEPAGRGETWDILYSEIVAKGSYNAYPVGTRIYFDMEPNPGASGEYQKKTYLNTYDYAVCTGYIDGNSDSDYSGAYRTVDSNNDVINSIYTLPDTCKDDNNNLDIESGGYWIFIDNNGFYEFFAVKSSGNGGSITVDPQTKYVTPSHVYTNYTETVTDDVIFYNRITNETELIYLFSNGGYGFLASDITINSVLTTSPNVRIDLFLNGKTINLNEKHIKVCSSATFNLYDNGTTGTIKKGNHGDGGAFEVVDKNTVFNMYGGTIKDCNASRGGGVHVNLDGTFHMYNGLITGNTASFAGGGVFNRSETSFHMHGGTIEGNYAEEYGGGVYNVENMSFDGKCIVDDNYAGPEDNKIEENVYTSNPFKLYYNDQTSLGLTEGSKVGITYGYGIGPITYNYSNPNFDQAKQIDYFFADNPNYYVAYNAGTGSGGYLEIKEKVVCKIGTNEYTSIDLALKHGGTDASEKDPNTGESDSVSTKIIMIDNDVENVVIPTGRNITLDLNGYVLKANLRDGYYHRVITNKGYLTIVDGNSSVIRYFTDKKCPHGVKIGDVCNETICSSFSNTAIADGCYETYSNVKPNGVEDVDYIVVTGGCITGGVAGNGAGIYNDTTGNLTIIGGNIIGNVQIDNDGGGIFNNGTLILNGGGILGNAARNCGGGVDVYSGSFTMTDGKISHNNAIAETGGGVHVSDGTFVLTGGKISNNTAAQIGGVYNQGVLKFTGGSIVDNKASALAGGVLYFNYQYQQSDHNSDCILGGNAIIAGNKLEGEDSNLVLATYSPVTIGTGTGGNGVTAPTWTTPIGVTVLDGSFTSTAGAFTTNGKNIDTQYFVSDDNAYFVKYVTDHLELAVATVKIDKNITNGKIKVDNQEAGVGTTVTITATPNNGYELDKITVTDKDGDPIIVDNSGKFVMPADSSKIPVTVSATFKKKVSDNTGYKVVNTGVEGNNNSGLKPISLLSLLGIAKVTIAKKKKH